MDLFLETGLPRIGDVPEIAVEIIPSSDPPGGLSGLGTVALAPAVANAIHAGSGKRMRSLPFDPMAAARPYRPTIQPFPSRRSACC